MDVMHILLIDFNASSCPEKHCKQLKQIISHPCSVLPKAVQIVKCSSIETITITPDFIFLRISSDNDLSDLIQRLKKECCAVPIFGLLCMAQSVQYPAMHIRLEGLDDFITCPLRDIDVLPRMQKVWQSQDSHLRTICKPPRAGYLAQLQQFGLLGESRSFLDVMEQALNVARVDATILLTGETGTGKELVARSIHCYSERYRQPFVPINCGALPEPLVENELFGHMKGAYTDATSPEKGLVAEADGGTLFLDEVDALSPATQVKLLRFLQEREYRPVGGTRYQTADVRVIAASNADLWHLVQSQQFREDLYYRLNVIALRLPPLRERRDDIPQLALHFLHRYKTHYGREIDRVAAEALRQLMAYAWPGNIRELETVIQRAVLVATTPVLTPEDIKLNDVSEQPIPQDMPLSKAKEHVVAQFERSYLSNLLTVHRGNITRAAKQAGKERRAFTRLLDKYHLQRSAFLT
jgi:DNA-binding NtrC family response regulator